MIRLWYAACAAFALLFAAGAGWAAPRPGVVSAGVLNVRAKPARHFERIGKFERGDTVQVVSETDEWLEVILPPDAKAWVARQFIDANGVVTASSLQVRSGPGVVFTSYADVPQGTALKLVGPPLDEWQQVLPPAAATGWVSRAYVRMVEPAAVEAPAAKPAAPPAAPTPAEPPKPAAPPVVVEKPPAPAKPAEKPIPVEPPKPVEKPAAKPIVVAELPKPPEKPTAPAPPPAPAAKPAPVEPATVSTDVAATEYIRRVVQDETGVEVVIEAKNSTVRRIPEPKPVEKPKPVEQPKPVAKPPVVEKPKPVEQPQPVVVEKPKPAEALAPMEKPAAIEKPKPAEAPVVMAKPRPAEQPKPAEKPAEVVVEKPKPAEAPVVMVKPKPAEVVVEKPTPGQTAMLPPKLVDTARPAGQPTAVDLLPKPAVVAEVKPRPAEKPAAASPPVPQKTVNIVEAKPAAKPVVSPQPVEKPAAAEPPVVQKTVDIVEAQPVQPTETPAEPAEKPAFRRTVSFVPPQSGKESAPQPKAPEASVAPKPAAVAATAPELALQEPVRAPEAPEVARPTVPKARYEAPVFVANVTPPPAVEPEPAKPELPAPAEPAATPGQEQVVPAVSANEIAGATAAQITGQADHSWLEGVVFPLKEQAVPEASHILYRREGTVCYPICYLRSSRLDLSQWELREVRLYGDKTEVRGWSRPVIDVRGIQLKTLE